MHTLAGCGESPGEISPPGVLPEPRVNLSIHTAPDVQPLKCIIGGFAAVTVPSFW